MSLKFPDISVYWDQASVAASEDAGTKTISLRRDVPVEREADGVSLQEVTVTATNGNLSDGSVVFRPEGSRTHGIKAIPLNGQ